MPSTQIQFNVAVGYKARNDIKTKTGINIKITNKIGTQRGTIFAADIVGTRDQIANATKMIRDAEDRAFDWAQKNKEAREAFRHRNEMNYNMEPAQLHPIQKKSKPSSKMNRFHMLEVEEATDVITTNGEKPHTKASNKNAARHAKRLEKNQYVPSFADMAAKLPKKDVATENSQTNSADDISSRSHPKRVKFVVEQPTQKADPSSVSWGDEVWNDDSNDSDDDTEWRLELNATQHTLYINNFIKLNIFLFIIALV